MKQSWYAKRWVTVLLHLAAWTLLFSLPYLLDSAHDNKRAPHENSADSRHSIYFTIIMNATWVLYFYFNALLLVPSYIYRKKYWQFALIQLLVLGWLMLQLYLVSYFVFGESHFHSRSVMFNFFIYLFIFSMSMAYQLISDRVRFDKLAKEKENENLKTELSFLRSQVSPHFMFNVLNNMVSLARKKSDILEPSLIKLSSLMRYMLYEADEEKVPLERECEYLQSYIDLQKQRFGSQLSIEFLAEEPDGSYQIEPMLLIPFVENAFKHGTGMLENAQIHIELRARNAQLQFSVRNRYNPGSLEIRDKTSGIGLTNVKRRLNLLYGGNHTLLINKNEDWFMISLQLNLH